MTTPATFKKADVTRLVRALEAAGKSVTSVKIDPLGNVVANCAELGAPRGVDGANPWDEVLAGGQGTVAFEGRGRASPAPGTA